jgi:AAA15 family ATPase/GTPase
LEHIQNIEIKNFKSIRHASIDGCRRVNVFIGAPNVGKSNILEALGLFMYVTKSSVLSAEIGLNDILRFESFVHLLHFGDISNESSVQFNHSRKCNIEYKNAYQLTLNFQYSSTSPGNFAADGNYVFDLNNLSNPELKALFTENIEEHIKIVKEYPEIKRYIFSGKKFGNSISAKDLAVPFGDNLFEVLRYNADVRKEVGELFNQYGLKLSFSEDTKLNIFKQLDEFTIFNIPFGQIADTLQRLIFYKTAIQTTSDAVLLFEEPEAHMYPPYIAKFTSDMMYDENNNQYFITTHSPFVVNDIMENLKKEEYSIYTVGYDKANGETLVKRLSDEELHEIYQYGIDLFLNLENYLPHEHKQ